MAKRLLQFRRIGASILLLFVSAIAIRFSAGSVVPHFPNATLVVSDVHGNELGSCGLQDSQSPYTFPDGTALSIQMKRCEFHVKGTEIKLDWRLVRSSTMADAYEFKIVTGTNGLPVVKRIDVSSETIKLFKSQDFAVEVKNL